MARRTIAERLAQIEAQKKTLQARLGQQERAHDTRRKVLLGALVLQRLEAGHDPAFTQRLADWLRRELPGFLTREADRALFADLIGAPGGDGAVAVQAPGTDATVPSRDLDPVA
ncbi:mobilization protein [Methylobacterium sp. Leaf469]|uniref:hypothetical protein n=1 Tax=Methylobacterium sp. Leaf469 TaxID=1736387 RepID=UPI000701ACCE|nr:hypothetical protein [Methylobacterium sp. Leaf469]KQT95717.1 mobilization protein [Methylobacterium sp. Leaf469]